MVIALSSFAFGISLSPLISLIAGILILIMPRLYRNPILPSKNVSKIRTGHRFHVFRSGRSEATPLTRLRRR